MRVCIDIQSAIAQRAGVGRYTRSLVEHLAALRGCDDVTLFYFDFKRQGAPFPTPGMRQAPWRMLPGRWVQGAWKTVGWPPFDRLAGRADVYHFPNFILPPMGAGRTAVTIHDVSFIRFPGYAEARNLKYLVARIGDTVRRADAIITVSRFSAGEIVSLLGVPEPRVRVIHPGIADTIRRASADGVQVFRARHGLNRPYLLTVGTIEPRKNLEFLVRVFERMTAFDGDLVVAGMRGWNYQPILEALSGSSRAARIRYLDYVADGDLPALYSGAELFVFPSVYEGFGFPPLEAMACGTAVLSSAAGSLAEVLGDAARLVEGYDPDVWASMAQRLLESSDDRSAGIQRGLRQAARYSWRETARKTWDLYRQVGA